MNLISVENLHVRYGSYEAVKGVSFSLGAGEILGIVGESGSGKSTIAKTLMGLEKATSGTIAFHSDATGRKPAIQMIFQDAVGSLNPRMTIRQTLEEVVRLHPQADQPPATPADLLAQVGLSLAVLDQYPREMSGGQCQRVSIARALACHPQVLVADEPVSALDVSVQARVLNLLRDLRRDLGLSILLIAHDLAVVKNVCDRICVMERGRFVDAGAAAEVFSNPQSDYTRRLLSAVPRLPFSILFAGALASCWLSGCQSAFEHDPNYRRSAQHAHAASRAPAPPSVRTFSNREKLRLAPSDAPPEIEATFACSIPRPEDPALAQFVDDALNTAGFHMRGEARRDVTTTGATGLRDTFFADYREWFDEDGATVLNGDAPTHVGNWTCDVRGEIVFCDSRYFSYRVTIDTTTGGPHPYRRIQNATYLRQTGKRLTVADMFRSDQLTTVVNLIRQAVRKEARARGDTDVATRLAETVRQRYDAYAREIREGRREAWGNPLVTENFLLTSRGIAWTYNQYEIACYASGTFTAFIPWADLPESARALR